MKYIKRAICLALVLIFAFIYAHVDVKSYIYDRNIDSSDYGVTGVEENVIIKQSFKVHEDVIEGIEIKCSVSGDLSIYDNRKIKYSIWDENNEEIESHEVSINEFENNKFYLLKFDDVTNCRDKIYTLVLEEKEMKTGTGIGFYFTPVIEDETNFIVNGNATEGTLVMRTVTHQFDVETFVIVLCFAVYLALFLKLLYKLFR